MPYSPIISKIRCHNPNLSKAKVCNRNYLIYIGTREGVDLSDPEFEKSIQNDLESPNNIYMKYIAERPKSHGLFGNIDVSDIQKLSNQIADMTHEGKNIYRGIVSLSEKDADNLGFDKKEKWIDFMKTTMPDIGHEFNIPIDKLQWTAAIHMEKGHPHCHYMFWQAGNKVQSPYIHTSVQNRCRQIFAKEAFHEEREQLIIDKTISRDTFLELGKNVLEEGSALMNGKIPDKFTNNELKLIASKLIDLTQTLPASGRLNYKLLPPDVKYDIDCFVNELLEIPSLKKEYVNFLSINKRISDTYSATSSKENITMSHADKDIKKRLANLVLNTCKTMLQCKKNICNEYNRIPFPEIDIEPNNLLVDMPNPADDGFANFPPSLESNTDFIDIDFLQETERQNQLKNNCKISQQNNNFCMKWSAGYKKGLAFMYSSDEEEQVKSISFFEKECEKNNVLAFYNLGRIYDKGIGIEVNADKASENYQKAFQGFKELIQDKSMSKWSSYLAYRIGKMYEHGLGTAQNFTEAIHYYQNAKSNKYAQYSLGNLYLFGKGTDVNIDLAYKYFKKSAGYKNPNAMFALGKIYTDNTNKFYNLEKGLSLLNELAIGEAPISSFAQYHLGKLYYEIENPDLPPDIEKAMSYFMVSASLNNQHAQFCLGKIYADPENDFYNIDKAMEWFQKAAGQDNAFAQYNLGKIYADPEAGHFNIDTATQWFQKAADQNNAFAQYGLGKIYADPEAGHFNIDTAIQWFQKAADQGNSFAQLSLGSLYLWGKHVPADEALGKHWLNLALENDNPFAQNILDSYENYQQQLSINVAFSLLRNCFNSLLNQSKQQSLWNMDKKFQSQSKENRRAQARILKNSHNHNEMDQ